MDRFVERCAGLDVHKDSVAATVRVPGAGGQRVQETSTFPTTTRGLLTLADWLESHAVTLVGMELTGRYWKPLLYRYEARRKAYRRLYHSWGNVGYSLRDLDRDGRPELVSADDRFAYAFTSFAGSLFPLQVWRYRDGTLAEVTPAFPAAARREADRLWRDYLEARKDESAELRGLLAAYLADEIHAGRDAQGWARLQAALHRGDLSPPQQVGPKGKAYLKALRAFLVKNGYLTAKEAAARLPL